MNKPEYSGVYYAGYLPSSLTLARGDLLLKLIISHDHSENEHALSTGMNRLAITLTCRYLKVASTYMTT
jgi:hypothetical protein